MVDDYNQELRHCWAPRKLKTTLQRPADPADKTDRSRNMMIFGLTKEENEATSKDTVTEVFEELEEKPVIAEVCRIGEKRTDGKPRHVKVIFRTRETLLFLLKKAQRLKERKGEKSRFSDVYLHPDRTIEERRERRKCLQTLSSVYIHHS